MTSQSWHSWTQASTVPADTHHVGHSQHASFRSQSLAEANERSVLSLLNVETLRCSNGAALPYKNLNRILCRHFSSISSAMLEANLPLTQSGHPSSMGSVLHAAGICKPCRYILASEECPYGTSCLFCHLDHSTLCNQVESHCCCLDEDDGLDKKHEPRRNLPSKQARDHYKRAAQQLEAEVLQDPFGWSIESVEIPHRIARKPDVKKKLLMRLARFADAARSSQMHQMQQEPLTTNALALGVPVSSRGNMGSKCSSSTSSQSNGWPRNLPHLILL